jgi:ribonuclease-3
MITRYYAEPDRKSLLRAFEKKLDMSFRDQSLLEQAFRHRSFSNETTDGFHNNERLEFLGDAVLGMIVAEYLYKKLPGKPEGELSKIKSFVVSEFSLSDIAVEIGIDHLLILGKGEELSGGRTKKAILADAMEAVFGALFLDSGFKAAEKLVLFLLVPQIEKVLNNEHHRDYKTLLQEYFQKKYKRCPLYELVKISGPDHDRTFWASVHLDDQIFGPEKGKNKKEAEQAAARKAWELVAKEAAGQTSE